MLALSEGRSGVFLSFCLLLLCLHSIDGQSTDDLAKLANGTLPNAAAFQASFTQVTQGDKQGFISSKPQSSGFEAAPKGIVKLGLASSGRDGYLYVPAQYDPSRSSSMILAIHAAGKGGLDALQILVASANSSGILLLAPESRGATWDALPAAQGSFGPDVAFINAALAQTFQLYNVDATTLGIQGFSDGATYALGLGMINGELFRKVMANSPGGILADTIQGHPPVFMSAGLQDNIFPVQQAGNADACYLEQEGYTVTYVQFNGMHEVPPAIAADTIKWYQGSFQQAFPQSVCTG